MILFSKIFSISLSWAAGPHVSSSKHRMQVATTKQNTTTSRAPNMWDTPKCLGSSTSLDVFGEVERKRRPFGVPSSWYEVILCSSDISRRFPSTPLEHTL